MPIIGLVFGLYKPVVRFQIPRLSRRAGTISAVTGAFIATAGYLGGAALSQSVGLGAVFALLLFALLLFSRYEARLMLGASATNGIPVAVYGAGNAGRQLVEVLRRGQERLPVAFIDDDTSLRGRTIEDLPVFNPIDKRFRERLLSKSIQEVLLAIPSATPGRRREILEFLGDMPFHVRSVPGLSELASGKSSAVAELKEVAIEDLLGREPVEPLRVLLEHCVRGKVVMVTGGGGSIGGELCKQVLGLQPKQLIVFDHSEYALYCVEQELRLKPSGQGESLVRFVLGSVTDANLVSNVIENNRVDTIYHAAAYKHVPMVESNPVEGLRNNVLGTWYVGRAAAKANVSHFVLISSDKAVRPTNVMGATKRMAELVVQMLAATNPSTIFSMVRFGNVLDSSGSVVPLFRQQIERGGPVTLTHAEVTRYFMTIHEAVQLVIQAGAMAQGGEVFVLEMGKPVKIYDLAVKMIHLSGRSTEGEPNDHQNKIAIELVGLRPGEKLYEELLIDGNATGTVHPRIWKAYEKSAEAGELIAQLADLETATRTSTSAAHVFGILRRWVEGYSGGELLSESTR